jgi:hypothetical protein
MVIRGRGQLTWTSHSAASARVRSSQSTWYLIAAVTRCRAASSASGVYAGSSIMRTRAGSASGASGPAATAIAYRSPTRGAARPGISGFAFSASNSSRVHVSERSLNRHVSSSTARRTLASGELNTSRDPTRSAYTIPSPAGLASRSTGCRVQSATCSGCGGWTRSTWPPSRSSTSAGCIWWNNSGFFAASSPGGIASAGGSAAVCGGSSASSRTVAHRPPSR